MNIYVFNKGNAPIVHGIHVVIAPQGYGVLESDLANQLKSSFPLLLETGRNFKPLWVRNVPIETPDNVADRL